MACARALVYTPEGGHEPIGGPPVGWRATWVHSPSVAGTQLKAESTQLRAAALNEFGFLLLTYASS